MGKQAKELTPKDIKFIEAQKLFYVASASNSEVNLSPKGHDSLRVLDESTLLFMNYSGSGNRSYRDASNDGEFTLVFNAFEGTPKILRLFCKASIVHREDERFHEYLAMFKEKASLVRNFYLYHIYAVETSCGYTVPIMEFKEERTTLKKWMNNFDERGKLEPYNKKNFNPPNLNDLK